MQLCRICDNLNIQQCRKEDGLLAIYRFPDLEKGASHGCSFCYLLCHTLEKQIETAKPVYRGTGCLYLYMLSDGLRVTKNASAGLQINQLVVSIAQGYWGMSPRLLFGPDGESNDMYTARQTYRVMAGISRFSSSLTRMALIVYRQQSFEA
jgi:hypothetical protein